MIKTYELINPYIQNPIHAIFYYNQDNHQFGLFIPDEVKNTELPFIFNIYVQKGIRHLNDEQTRRWIKDRITPPSRQNIGMILKEVGIKQYDEFEILIYNKGRSCMDEFYLEECSLDLLNSYINQENNYELENDNV